MLCFNQCGQQLLVGKRSISEYCGDGTLSSFHNNFEYSSEVGCSRRIEPPLYSFMSEFPADLRAINGFARLSELSLGSCKVRAVVLHHDGRSAATLDESGECHQECFCVQREGHLQVACSGLQTGENAHVPLLLRSTTPLLCVERSCVIYSTSGKWFERTTRAMVG